MSHFWSKTTKSSAASTLTKHLLRTCQSPKSQLSRLPNFWIECMTRYATKLTRKLMKKLKSRVRLIRTRRRRKMASHRLLPKELFWKANVIYQWLSGSQQPQKQWLFKRFKRKRCLRNLSLTKITKKEVKLLMKFYPKLVKRDHSRLQFKPFLSVSQAAKLKS